MRRERTPLSPPPDAPPRAHRWPGPTATRLRRVPPSAPASSAADQLPTRAAAVWAALDPLVAAGRPLRVLDVGGGSGNFSVPLARLGPHLTLVHPRADAPPTLKRRA